MGDGSETDFFTRPRALSSRRRPAHEPEAALPGTLALDRVIGSSDSAVVALSAAFAYPWGFSFEVSAHGRPGAWGDMNAFFAESGQWRDGNTVTPPDGFCRLGLVYPDGQMSTNLHWSVGQFADGAAAVMMEMAGGFGGNESHVRFWAAPLPPPRGSLELVCEWPAADIELTRTQIDPGAIVLAASQARVLFSEQTEAR